MNVQFQMDWTQALTLVLQDFQHQIHELHEARGIFVKISNIIQLSQQCAKKFKINMSKESNGTRSKFWRFIQHVQLFIQ